MSTPTPPTIPTLLAAPMLKPVSLVFIGPIQNPAVKNLRNTCCGAVTNGTKEIQILFSSGGGDVLEAFSLHNFLRALPVKLTMHCIGSVDSAAMPVFLAGEERFCCPDSTFLFHDFTTNFPGPGSVSRIQLSDLNTSSEGWKRRSQYLLKSRAAFTDEQLQALKLYDKVSIYDAAFAQEKRIVHDIKEARIAAGSLAANIDC